MILQAEVNRENLFGSGRQVKFKIDHSDINKIYDIGYTNPYFTPDGISLGFFAELEDIDTAKTTSADYISDTVSVGGRTRIPVSEHNAFHLRAAYEQIELEATESTPTEYSSFIDRFPESDNYTLTAGVTRDTRDSIFFPAKGYFRRASAEFAFPGSDLEYYKLTLRGRWYRSVTDNLVISLKGNVGYGDGFLRLDENKKSTIQDKRNILGRVSMNNLTVEGTDAKICVFDNAKELAKTHNTIPYEILCRIRSSIKKRII